MTHTISQMPDSQLMLWRMTSALKISLPEVIRCDELSPNHLSDMLCKCARCPASQYCSLFLATRADQAEAPPKFCPCRKVLSRLRKAFSGEASPSDAADERAYA